MMWPDLGKCIENMKLIDKVTETKYLPYPSRSRRIKNKKRNKRRNKRKKWKMMNKEELMKELLNRYEQRKSIQNQCTLFILDNYIEKLERKLKELL